MSAVHRAQPGHIRLDLILPVTRVGFGPFSFDPIEQMIGAPLADILESLLVAPVQRRPSAAGAAVDVYPLALPDGEGASIPLGAWGELGFFNDGGLLMLTTPFMVRSWLLDRLSQLIVRGPVEQLSTDGTARVVTCWIRIHPGMRAGLPVGGFGEVAIQAA